MVQEDLPYRCGCRGFCLDGGVCSRWCGLRNSTSTSSCFTDSTSFPQQYKPCGRRSIGGPTIPSPRSPGSWCSIYMKNTAVASAPVRCSNVLTPWYLYLFERDSVPTCYVNTRDLHEKLKVQVHKLCSFPSSRPRAHAPPPPNQT